MMTVIYLLSDFQKEKETRFQNFCRMSFQTFNELHEIIINNYYITINFVTEILKKFHKNN